MLEQLGRMRVWYIDATFKVVRRPFVQLFSVHGFLKAGSCIKQVPLAFVLMTGRRTEDYNAVLQAIRDMLPTFSMLKCVADFEAAMWQSMRATFPQADIRGCLFHFTQAIYRKIMNVGLHQAYMQDPGTRELCRSFMALALLPHHHVETMFERLAARATTPMLDQLLDYMRRTWIEGAMFTPVDWSVYGMPIRTNNDVEGWHNKLNGEAGSGNVSFYKLAGLLHKEARFVTLTMGLVQREQMTRRQRAGAKSSNEKLMAYWTEYQDNKKTAEQLVEAGRHLLYEPEREGLVDGDVV